MTNTDKDKFTTIEHEDDFRNNYSSSTTWAEILEPHGWVCLRSDIRGELWEPPGRSGSNTPGAALAHEHGPLTVFTKSTAFEAGTPYSKFDAYAVLNHNTDMQAAAQALHNQGFGVFRERNIDGNQIVRCGKYSYMWPADQEPLAVGDTVELPPPVSAYAREIYGDRPRQATVTHLGTYYSGPLVQVAHLVKKATPPDPKNGTT